MQFISVSPAEEGKDSEFTLKERNSEKIFEIPLKFLINRSNSGALPSDPLGPQGRGDRWRPSGLPT